MGEYESLKTLAGVYKFIGYAAFAVAAIGGLVMCGSSIGGNSEILTTGLAAGAIVMGLLLGVNFIGAGERIQLDVDNARNLARMADHIGQMYLRLDTALDLARRTAVATEALAHTIKRQ